MQKWIANKLRHRQVWQLAGLLAADAAVFGGTDPQQVASYVLIIGFGLLAATMYCLLGALLAVAGWYGISLPHKRRLQVTGTGLAAGLVALQSIGQLSSRDVLVVASLTLLVFLYTTYAAKNISPSKV